MGDLSTLLWQLALLVLLSIVVGGGIGWLTDRKDRRR